MISLICSFALLKSAIFGGCKKFSVRPSFPPNFLNLDTLAGHSATRRRPPHNVDQDKDSPYSAQVPPRFSPDSGHLRSSWNLHIICTMTRVVHMQKRMPSHLIVWPPEVIKGHEVKFCTVDCGSPKRARVKPTMPKYSQGRKLKKDQHPCC